MVKAMQKALLPAFILTLNVLLFRPVCATAYIDGEMYRDHVFIETIRTVLFHKKGWELSYPIIELRSNDRLELSFDDLTNNIRTISYTVIHCDADWKPSSIEQNEYIEGFVEYTLNEYYYSFNTTVPYIHYRLTIPNDDMLLKYSGNYILLLFEDFDRNKPILTRRFSVYQPQVNIRTDVHRPTLTGYQETGQEVDVTVDLLSLKTANPMQEIKLVIRQNGRWDNALTGLKPLFYKDNLLVYDYHLENVFPGGNEFRYFDIKSLRFQSEFIQKIDLIKPYFHVLLFPSEPRPYNPYFFENEINGRYYIKVQEGQNSYTDADYVYVYFSLKYDIPFARGRIYLLGSLSDWNFSRSNEMVYNFDTKSYETTLLLKQGYYNYSFAYLTDESMVANTEIIEGSHYQTENDYLVYIYFRGPSSRYDQLVGVDIVNTVASR